MKIDVTWILGLVMGLAVQSACAYDYGLPTGVVKDPLDDYCNVVSQAAVSRLTTGTAVYRFDLPIGDNGTTVVLLGSDTNRDPFGYLLVAYYPVEQGYKRFVETEEGAEIRIRLDFYGVCTPHEADGTTTAPFVVSADRYGNHAYGFVGGRLYGVNLHGTVDDKDYRNVKFGTDDQPSPVLSGTARFGFDIHSGQRDHPFHAIEWKDLPVTTATLEAITELERAVDERMARDTSKN